METWFQYRDPLVGVLDYIAEVRPPGLHFLPCLYLARPKRNVRRTMKRRVS